MHLLLPEELDDMLDHLEELGYEVSHEQEQILDRRGEELDEPVAGTQPSEAPDAAFETTPDHLK